MKMRRVSFRSLILGAAFVAAMGFGAAQAVATETGTAGTQYESCNSWACRNECPGFGGSLGPGGPGKPLQCYCCG